MPGVVNRVAGGRRPLSRNLWYIADSKRRCWLWEKITKCLWQEASTLRQRRQNSAFNCMPPVPAPRNWKRRPGLQRHTWLRTVEEDLRQFNLGLASGLRRAQNRTAWLTLTGTATSPTSSDWLNDKSVAYVTTFCTVEANYWQTRSIARPLCDSRLSRATCWRRF